MDTIVAAVAQANGCNVVTDNEGEFQGIEIIKPRNLNACQTPIVASRHRSARSTGVARRAGTSDFSISTISSSQWCQQIFAHGLLSPGARDLPRTLLSRARVFQAKLTARFWLTAALEGRWRARLPRYGTIELFSPFGAMKRLLFGSMIFFGSLGFSHAQELSPDSINNSDVLSGLDGQVAQDPPVPKAAIVHLQVLLDRAGASPGVIDGFDGANVSKAIAGFEAMQHLPVDGKLDALVVERLGDDKHVIGPYIIAPDDADDLVSEVPKDYAEQAKMDHLGYTSIPEKLSERFHMDIDLLHALNPSAKFSPGETISVAVVGAPRTGRVKRIEARRADGQLVAFADDGDVLAIYPATIGSEDNPSPSGKHKVNGVARNPTYEYNPRVNFQQGKNRTKLTLPSGPNNPVGSVWIDLSEPTYGIHGTPEPSLIDKTGSHGCVRLTNWDVEELASMVKPGVVVVFTE
ncbi:lipoprotein-anchoring transpeptidase ErfK/SrfK [Rhizobium sp. OAE497]